MFLVQIADVTYHGERRNDNGLGNLSSVKHRSQASTVTGGEIAGIVLGVLVVFGVIILVIIKMVSFFLQYDSIQLSVHTSIA